MTECWKLPVKSSFPETTAEAFYYVLKFSIEEGERGRKNVLETVPETAAAAAKYHHQFITFQCSEFGESIEKQKKWAQQQQQPRESMAIKTSAPKILLRESFSWACHWRASLIGRMRTAFCHWEPRIENQESTLLLLLCCACKHSSTHSTLSSGVHESTQESSHPPLLLFLFRLITTLSLFDSGNQLEQQQVKMATSLFLSLSLSLFLSLSLSFSSSSSLISLGHNSNNSSSELI